MKLLLTQIKLGFLRNFNESFEKDVTYTIKTLSPSLSLPHSLRLSLSLSLFKYGFFIALCKSNNIFLFQEKKVLWNLVYIRTSL